MTVVGIPFANILHQEAIAELAGSSSFERGKRYFAERRVVAVARRDGSLTATVNGSGTYAVKIWSHLDTLAYSCSCPQGQEKAFCKHAVATALAWLDGARASLTPEEVATEPSPAITNATSLAATLEERDARGAAWEPLVQETLEARTKAELVELLVGAARRDEVLRARLLRR